MKRKLLVALMAMAMTASLAACGGGETPAAEDAPAETSEETPAAEEGAEEAQETPAADSAEGDLIQAAYLTKSRSEVWQLMSQGVVDQAAEELRCSDFVPLAFELSFGDGPEKDLPAVVISEPDGELRVGGKVDRVDGWLKDGRLYLRVVDYKSGKKSFDLSAVRAGLDIQMLLYLFALQKTGPARFGAEIEPAGVLYLPARDDILSAQRNIPPEKLREEREKQLRRSGLLLAEPRVLRAMEHEALTEPRYLPLRVDRSGNLSGSLASAAQLGRLSRYVDRLLRDISRELRQGVVDADPCCRSEEDSPCRCCDWAPACHFQDGRDSDRLRYILQVKPEEFWNALESEGGDSPCP